MKAKLLDNGNLLIPVRVEGHNGETGDAMIEVKPGSKDFNDWLPFISEKDKEKLNSDNIIK